MTLEKRMDEIARLRLMAGNKSLKPFLRRAAHRELKRAIRAYTRAKQHQNPTGFLE